MDTNEKLDKVIGLLEVIVEKLQDLQEENEELREGISNLSLPGTGYSTFSPEDE